MISESESDSDDGSKDRRRFVAAEMADDGIGELFSMLILMSPVALQEEGTGVEPALILLLLFSLFILLLVVVGWVEK